MKINKLMIALVAMFTCFIGKAMAQEVVAEVGGVEYTDIYAAFTDAKNNDMTVEIRKNLELNKNIIISNYANVAVEGDGYTLRFTNSEKDGFVVKSNANVTFGAGLNIVGAPGVCPLTIQNATVTTSANISAEGTSDAAIMSVSESSAQLTINGGTVVANGADLGISVDPDVDRLALICENGKPFGEEYTLVSVADYLLDRARQEDPSAVLATSSNLSSSRALRDVTEKYDGTYHAAAVGEVNVTTKMKECGALIGGEGNGGVIYPALHYGRDAMVGVALFLTNLAYKKMKVSELLATYPEYVIAKNKIELSDSGLIDRILDQVKTVYAAEDINTIDGVKISFEQKREWVHLRRSNTEPIIRIYAEAADAQAADALAQQIIDIAGRIIG